MNNIYVVCENPSGEDWVPRERGQQQQEDGDEESPSEEAKIRKLHRMKEFMMIIWKTRKH
jgi:hypothetical protein